MIKLFVVKPKAVRDVNAYVDYLAEVATLKVAMRFFEAAYATFDLLSKQPGIG